MQSLISCWSKTQKNRRPLKVSELSNQNVNPSNTPCGLWYEQWTTSKLDDFCTMVIILKVICELIGNNYDKNVVDRQIANRFTAFRQLHLLETAIKTVAIIWFFIHLSVCLSVHIFLEGDVGASEQVSGVCMLPSLLPGFARRNFFSFGSIWVINKTPGKMRP